MDVLQLEPLDQAFHGCAAGSRLEREEGLALVGLAFHVLQAPADPFLEVMYGQPAQNLRGRLEILERKLRLFRLARRSADSEQTVRRVRCGDVRRLVDQEQPQRRPSVQVADIDLLDHLSAGAEILASRFPGLERYFDAAL